MSARPRPSFLRATTARLAVAGAAGLATVFTIAPVAAAADAPSTDTDTDTTTTSTVTTEAPAPTDETPPPADETPDPTDETPPPADETPDPAEQDPATEGASPGEPADQSAKDAKSADAADEAIVPNFGLQKYRVGVKIADGSWVPEDTTTVGTTFTITETGPSASGGSDTFTCTTDASTVDPADKSKASFCVFPEASMALAKAAKGGVEVGPDPGGPGAVFIAGPGDTVTITQKTAAPNLVKSSDVATTGPCEFVDENPCEQSLVLFANTGFPPIARDDKRTTREGVAIDIGVLKNDDTVNGAPVTGLDLDSKPHHGTAKVHGQTVTYDPEDGFTGKDTFDYTLSTANGSSTATVTVTIEPAPVSDDAVLPDTGGVDSRLVGLGLLLVASGGWLTARGRRPRRADALV